MGKAIHANSPNKKAGKSSPRDDNPNAGTARKVAVPSKSVFPARASPTSTEENNKTRAGVKAKTAKNIDTTVELEVSLIASNKMAP